MPSRRPSVTRTAALWLLGAVALCNLSAGFAFAQDIPPGILAPGDAVVTGFSGALLPVEVPSGVDPEVEAVIDLDGASARIVDLSDMRGPPRAQLVPAKKLFTLTAAQIGQVFAVALDNAVPPNIYVAATSSYGLSIATQAPDGKPVHIKTGAPNAVFMPGQWGPPDQNGGPGAIWKIDGVTGAVSLFANVALNGRPNSGPALGGLAYDPQSNSLYVADRETGMIHRFDMRGTDRGTFDHGMQGLQSAGQPPVAFDSNKQLDITSPQFNSANPDTWNYAAPERRVFGLGVRAGRLYYAVADGLRIWSTGLNPDGSFAGDTALEVEVPPGNTPTEISKITFDDQGRMFLAERPMPTGAFDFAALTQAPGRVLRYAIVDQYPGAPRVWQSQPSEYAIGFPIDFQNGNGGVAVGYNYNELDRFDRSSCGGYLWSTGERLRIFPRREIILRLQKSGPLYVNGLQGNLIGLLRPMNEPPFRSYFIDYDDRFGESRKSGSRSSRRSRDLAGMRPGAARRLDVARGIARPVVGRRWRNRQITAALQA